MGIRRYEEWLTDEGLTLIEGWATDGLIDVEIAKNIGVTVKTLYEWEKRFPQIRDALKKGKEVVDRKVENALLQRALGIKETIKEPIKLKETLYENGRKVKETEKVVMAEKELYFPPDVTAQIFWLKNRKPEEWRDKREAEPAKEEGITIIDDIPLPKAGEKAD